MSEKDPTENSPTKEDPRKPHAVIEDNYRFLCTNLGDVRYKILQHETTLANLRQQETKLVSELNNVVVALQKLPKEVVNGKESGTNGAK